MAALLAGLMAFKLYLEGRPPMHQEIPPPEPDEADDEAEMEIVFTPDFVWNEGIRTVPARCPKCEAAGRRGKHIRYANDLSFWCYVCDEAFYPTLDGAIYPLHPEV